MSHSCAQWRGDIGACIVGALDGPARDRVTRHLAACAGCRTEYDELIPVRDWLAVVALTEPGLPTPQRRTSLPAIRPRARRWLVAAGAAMATAATVIMALVSSGAPARTFRAADRATGVSGSAQLTATPAGTQISLTASGLPSSERCILVAATRGGSDIAGSWAAAYDGSARIAGMTAIRAGQLTALRIESDTGVLLLSIRV
jgi:hypothetical protein